MYGYIISFEGMPQTVIACETKVKDYYWRNTHHKNMFEVSISKAEYIARCENGKTNEYNNVHAISCKTADADCYSYSTPETEVEITSVIVTFDKLSAVKKWLTPDDAQDKNILLIPDFLSNATPEQLNEINILLHRYIHYNNVNSSEYQLMRYSIFFEIIAKLDFYTRAILSPGICENNKQNQYYIRKTNSIIHKNFSHKISASEIAKELGITPVYLSSMYKKATGINVKDYILMTRMKKAEELLKNREMSTLDIAIAVGYENEGTFRKKFRKYFGMNIKEYKIIKKGNALYHNKPIRKTYEK